MYREMAAARRTRETLRGRGTLGARRIGALLASTCLAGSMVAGHALAAEAAPPATNDATLGEVVVTASRREETVTKLPFNISAYGAKQLQTANITSVTALSQQVPNFVIQDNGPRDAASSIPIIRGLNASTPANSSPRFFQTPVGFYLGNAPLTGYIPIEDVDRVEVLRGPQGTLYGAGALAGAVRIVPTDPKLGSFSGQLSGSIGGISHSSDIDSDVLGIVNIPIGQTLAVRIAAQREYDGGFIDQYGIMRRQGDNSLSGAPVLANPADVAGSQAVYFNRKDVNTAEIASVKAALLWQPNDRFKATLGYNFAHLTGDGGPVDDFTYGGGASPIDPRVTLGATGEYARSLPTLEPFHRDTHLATVDASYDLGFATLSGTFAYGHTDGEAVFDGTVNLLGTPYGAYYTGVPANPRTVVPVAQQDSESRYTEEVRLVSKQGGKFDYIVGAYLEQDSRHLGEDVYDPGADVQSAAANGGSTLPIVEGGTYIPLYANNASYLQDAYQTFRDYSIYGDLTYHITDRWQVTGGARFFHQTFSQRFRGQSTFFEFDLNETNANTVNSQIFKANTSYQIAEHAQVYFTFSQGFRRGGANTFSTSGAVLEPTDLLIYRPDKTNNYEIGIKGLAFGLHYAADVFYVDWSNPQIDLQTPYNLTSVVVNAVSAESKGVEFELSGPIGPKGLSFNLGMAYAPARLSADFHLPSGSGLGTVVPDAINGLKGDRLPGAPDFSLSTNLNYRVDLSDASAVTFGLGVDYRSSTVNVLPHLNTSTPVTTAPGYALLHGSVEYDRGTWQLVLYGTNLTDEHVVLAQGARTATSVSRTGAWGDSYVVARPRELGLRVTRKF